MREAFRLQQHRLSADPGAHFLIGYVYVGPAEPARFQEIQDKVIASLHYLNTLHVPPHDPTTP